MSYFEIESLISSREGGNPWEQVVKAYAPDFLTMTVVQEALEKFLPDSINCQCGGEKVNHRFQTNVHCCTNSKKERPPPLKFKVVVSVDRPGGASADTYTMAYVTDMPAAMLIRQALFCVTTTFTLVKVGEPNSRTLMHIRLSIAPLMAGEGPVLED